MNSLNQTNNKTTFVTQANRNRLISPDKSANTPHFRSITEKKRRLGGSNNASVMVGLKGARSLAANQANSTSKPKGRLFNTRDERRYAPTVNVNPYLNVRKHRKSKTSLVGDHIKVGSLGNSSFGDVE